ncbi:MAG: hypothetical protein JWQ71_4163 [Pedosphaera sp.]|nr:hypothetical protein [Pedosphaera sp.]
MFPAVSFVIRNSTFVIYAIILLPRMRSFSTRMIRRLLLAIFLPLLFLATGCHTFNHQWKQAARQPAPPDDLSGRWQGTWKSEPSGHTDQLRCLITRQSDGLYQARFKAKYHTVLTFGYTIPLQVQSGKGEYKFNGKADLGWLAGGLYHYEGHANPTNYFSTYTSKYDHGIFQMTRP